MHRVYITDYIDAPATLEESVLNGIAHVECLRATSAEQLIGKVNDAAGLLVYHEVSITQRVIEVMDRCRIIARCGVGVDNVNLAAASERGIYVCNVPDYGVDEVADHAIALMLACNRGLVRVERHVRETLRPWGYRAIAPAFRLSEATMGIIGLGRIGTATALRAKAMKMHVVACDPYIPDGIDKAVGVQMADLDTLLAESDVVSLHVPLTGETRHLIDADAFSKMKRRGILVNTARGAVVDVDALAAALQSRQIAGAGIDVLPDEPPQTTMPLIRLWRQQNESVVNLVITPHAAFYSEPALAEMRTKAAREVARVLTGQKPRNCVNEGNVGRNT